MKRFTLLMLAFVGSIAMQAQTVISQSVDPVTVNDGGVACWDNGTGDYFENSFFRSYDLTGDFGITGDFSLSAVEFGQGSAADNTVVNINIYHVPAGTFPGGSLTSVTSVQATLMAADDMTLVSVPVTGTIPAGTEAVFEINIPASSGSTSLRFFPGFNAAGQNAPSYLQATECGLDNPTDTAGISATDQYVMNLVGTDLSMGEHNLVQVSLYPNPVVNVLSITLPSSVELQSATMHDLLGKQTQVSISENNSIDMSQMAAGVYILKLETNQGVMTQKVIKQ